jgi:hypothetical protein
VESGPAACGDGGGVQWHSLSRPPQPNIGDISYFVPFDGGSKGDAPLVVCLAPVVGIGFNSIEALFDQFPAALDPSRLVTPIFCQRADAVRGARVVCQPKSPTETANVPAIAFSYRALDVAVFAGDRFQTGRVGEFGKHCHGVKCWPRRVQGQRFGVQSSPVIITVMAGAGSSMSSGPQTAISLTRRAPRLSFRT